MITLKILKLFANVVYCCFAFVCIPLSLWLLLNAQTFQGHGIAINGLLLFLLPPLCLLWRRQQGGRQTWKRLCISLGTAVLVLTTLLLINTPNGSSAQDSPVQNRFTQDTTFSRFMFSNIVPEIEQVNLGFSVASRLDPFFNREQRLRVSPFTFDLYKEMERDSNFHQLGSVLGWAYLDLFDRQYDAGHYFLYIPKNITKSPMPALVFLHGSVGNFKSYTWVLSKFAEEHSYIIISPSYGWGNWDGSGGVSTVLSAIEDAGTAVDIDPSRLYLAGISNGGLGVSHTASAAPEEFRALIYLSPVFPRNIIESDDFHSKWRGRPVLVITGESDRRIPVDYVTGKTDTLKSASVNATLKVYPGEDHFLFYSQSDEVLNDIANWLHEN